MANRASNTRSKWLCVCSLSKLGTAFLTAFLISILCILHIAPVPVHLVYGTSLHRPRKFLEIKPESSGLGRFGEMMVSFSRDDLPFTLFVPSESSFESLFRAMDDRSNMSGNASKRGLDDFYTGGVSVSKEDAFAVLSRIFGFSAVPRRVFSGMVPASGELALDSVSGYRLYLAREPGGAVLVNNIVCNRVDMTRGLIVIHRIDAIIMDAQFEQSVPYRDEFEEGNEVR